MSYEVLYIYQLCGYDEFGNINHIIDYFEDEIEAKKLKIALNHRSISENGVKCWIAYNKCLAIKVDGKYFLLLKKDPIEVKANNNENNKSG